MISDQLKLSILRAAFQGKLTKQLNEDGDAREILKDISKGKSKTIKKIDFTTSILHSDIPYDIPENWVWVRLSEVGSWSSGATPNRSNLKYYTNGTIPWLKTGDLNDSYINFVPEYITDLALKESSVKLHKKGTVLIAMYGATIGKIGILNIESTTNQACCACDLYNGINNRFLFYFLMSHKNEFISQASGGAQPNISKEKILINLIPLPPLAEQIRIVEKLDSILIEVEKLKHNEIKLNHLQKLFPQKMKDSIVQHAIQGKLTSQVLEDGDALDLISEIKRIKAQMLLEGRIKKEKTLLDISENEMPFDIPKSWVWVRLGDLSIQITDGTHKTPHYVNSGIPFLTIQNISSGEFNLSKLKYISPIEHSNISKRCKPELGDILFCRIGTLGKPIINTLDFEFSIFVSLALIKLVNNDLNEYLVYYLSSPAMNKWIDENKVGGGTHTNKINLRDLINVPIPLPPLSEQIRIVEYLREILPICENIEKNYNKLN